MSSLGRLIGLTRSLAIYHGIPGRQRPLRALYAEFVKPGAISGLTSAIAPVAGLLWAAVLSR